MYINHKHFILDGRYIGAILDRNGLRPSRYYLLKSNHLIMASEVGVVDVDPSEVLKKGRLRPGRMLLVDTLKKELTSDADIKNEICSARPAREWLRKTTNLHDLHEIYKSENPNFEEVMTKSMVSTKDCNNNPKNFRKNDIFLIEEDRRLPMFGYNIEILSLLLLPMIKNK